MKTYILLNVKLGTHETVVQRLKKIPNSSVNRVFGAYDIIITLYDTDHDSMKDVITWTIRSMDEIVSTLTLTSMETVLT